MAGTSSPQQYCELFMHHARALENGCNIAEATTWLTELSNDQNCITVLLLILAESTCPIGALFFASKILLSLLKNENWLQVNEHRLPNIMQIAFMTLFSGDNIQPSVRRQLAACVACIFTNSSTKSTDLRNQGISEILQIMARGDGNHLMTALEIFEEFPNQFQRRNFSDGFGDCIQSLRITVQNNFHIQVNTIVTHDFSSNSTDIGRTLAIAHSTLRCMMTWFNSVDISSPCSSPFLTADICNDDDDDGEIGTGNDDDDILYPTNGWFSLTDVTTVASLTLYDGTVTHVSTLDSLLLLLQRLSHLSLNPGFVRDCAKDVISQMDDCVCLILEILRESLLHPSPSDQLLSTVSHSTQETGLCCSVGIMKIFLSVSELWSTVSQAGLLTKHVMLSSGVLVGRSPAAIIALVEVSALIAEKHTHVLFGTGELFAESRRRGLASFSGDSLTSNDSAQAGVSQAAETLGVTQEHIASTFATMIMSCLAVCDQRAAVYATEAIVYLSQHLSQPVQDSILGGLAQPLAALILDRVELPPAVPDLVWLALEQSLESRDTFSDLHMDLEDVCVALLEYRHESAQILQAIYTKWPGGSNLLHEMGHHLFEALAEVHVAVATVTSVVDGATHEVGGVAGQAIVAASIFSAGRRSEALLVVMLALIEGASEILAGEGDSDEDDSVETNRDRSDSCGSGGAATGGVSGGVRWGPAGVLRGARGSSVGAALAPWLSVLAHATMLVNSVPDFVSHLPVVTHRLMQVWAVAALLIKPSLDSNRGLSVLVGGTTSAVPRQQAVLLSDVVCWALQLNCSALSVPALRATSTRTLMALTSNLLRHFSEKSASVSEWLLSWLSGDGSIRSLDATTLERLYLCLGRFIGSIPLVEARNTAISAALSHLTSQLSSLLTATFSSCASVGGSGGVAEGDPAAKSRLEVATPSIRSMKVAVVGCSSVRMCANSVSSLTGFVRGLTEGDAPAMSGIYLRQLCAMLVEMLCSLVHIATSRIRSRAGFGGTKVGSSTDDEDDILSDLMKQVGSLLSRVVDSFSSAQSQDILSRKAIVVASEADTIGAMEMLAMVIEKVGPVVQGQVVPMPSLLNVVVACVRQGSDFPPLENRLLYIVSVALGRAVHFMGIVEEIYSRGGYSASGEDSLGGMGEAGGGGGGGDGGVLHDSFNVDMLGKYLVEICRVVRQAHTLCPGLLVTPIPLLSVSGASGGGMGMGTSDCGSELVYPCAQFVVLVQRFVRMASVFPSVDVLRAFGVSWSTILGAESMALLSSSSSSSSSAMSTYLPQLYAQLKPHVGDLLLLFLPSVLYAASDKFIKAMVGFTEALLGILLNAGELSEAIDFACSALAGMPHPPPELMDKPVLQALDPLQYFLMVRNSLCHHAQQARSPSGKSFQLLMRKVLTLLAQVTRMNPALAVNNALLVWPTVP